MKCDVLIAGAGLSGAVAARFFAEKGYRVLVMEKERFIGGHCHDAPNREGLTVHTFGPHIFHTKERRVWDYVHRFSSFRPFQHRVLSYTEGQYYPFPVNCDTVNQVYNTHLTTSQVKDFIRQEAEAAQVSLPAANFRDAVISQVGEPLYRLFFEGYTRKQWDRDPAELSPELAKRIPIRSNRDDRYFSDPYQGIPARGYTPMLEAVLDHENITLMLNADYFEWTEAFQPRVTVFTGELDRFFDYEYGRLEYRSLRLEWETVEKEQFQQTAVVNYPNDYPWTRITEFKHFLGEKSPRTTILKEYPAAEGRPYYVVPSERNNVMSARYRERSGALQEAGTHLFLGRLAEYRYYNMDAAILSALDKCEGFLAKL